MATNSSVEINRTPALIAYCEEPDRIVKEEKIGRLPAASKIPALVAPVSQQSIEAVIRRKLRDRYPVDLDRNRASNVAGARQCAVREGKTVRVDRDLDVVEYRSHS